MCSVTTEVVALATTVLERKTVVTAAPPYVDGLRKIRTAGAAVIGLADELSPALGHTPQSPRRATVGQAERATEGRVHWQ